MPLGPCTTSAQTRRSTLAQNLAGVFVVACWLRLNATRARISDHRTTGRVTFTPWPAWAEPSRPTFHKRSARGYARQRMLACMAGPAAEVNHTHWPADSAKAEAQALSCAERIGARDQAQRWLNEAQGRARRAVRDPNIRPVVEAVAAELLRAGTVSAEAVPGIAGRVAPHPPFWRLPAREGGAR